MEINKRIGDYEILGELGQGGMGRVYRVRNVIADRVEAMKVLLPDLAGRQDLAARFLREIKVLAALNHPNIAALRTALTAGNQLVMIMEYVEGQSLAERLAHGPIATADALSYVDQVLDALAYAHGRGVVHRDIKPANMMLTASGVVKLTDFGIARSTTDETITVAGTTTGSLSYMAPEQVNGEATDARSDLYSVGISLYEMVTGQRPFRADNDFHVMLAHLKEEPRPPLELQPSLPPALNGIILRAIAKHPGARFQSAHEFREALAGVTARGSATTVLISTFDQAAAVEDLGRPASVSWASPAGSSTDHPRTVLDTRTPVAPHAAVPHSSSGSTPGGQPVVMRSGHPLLFVALGAALVIAALVGTGLYLGRAEAGPGRATEAAAPADPAARHTPPAEPAAAEGSDAAPQPEGSPETTGGCRSCGPGGSGRVAGAPTPSGPRSTVAPDRHSLPPRRRGPNAHRCSPRPPPPPRPPAASNRHSQNRRSQPRRRPHHRPTPRSSGRSKRISISSPRAPQRSRAPWNGSRNSRRGRDSDCAATSWRATGACGSIWRVPRKRWTGAMSGARRSSATRRNGTSRRWSVCWDGREKGKREKEREKGKAQAAAGLGSPGARHLCRVARGRPGPRGYPLHLGHDGVRRRGRVLLSHRRAAAARHGARLHGGCHDRRLVLVAARSRHRVVRRDGARQVVPPLVGFVAGAASMRLADALLRTSTSSRRWPTPKG
jgi:eukaryotic-like serine/threonine-protein kinase